MSPSQAIVCTCPFSLALTNLFVCSSTSVPIFRRELPNLSFLWVPGSISFLLLLILLNFEFLVFTLLHILRITVWKFSKEVLLSLSILFYYFSGSVDTILFYKTGDHLPQCLWFSSSFFIVDGCIDCWGHFKFLSKCFMVCFNFFF